MCLGWLVGKNKEDACLEDENENEKLFLNA